MSEKSVRGRRWGALAAAVCLAAGGLAAVAGVPAVAAPDAAVAGAPVVAGAADGTLTVFVRGADGTLYRRARDREDEGWSAWASTGGKAVGDPVTARNLNKRPSVFVRRPDGHLWYQTQAANGSWGAWADLGAPPKTAVAGAPTIVANDNTYSSPSPNRDGAVKGNTDGRLELFLRGADGHVWHLVQKAPNGTSWSKWESLPGTWVGNPTAATAGDGRISVFARKSDGRLRVIAQKHPSTPDKPLPAGNWSAWTQIGKGFTGNVSVAPNVLKKGTLFQVFGDRGDGRLWTVTQSEPGTSAKPVGAWGEGRSIGPAVPGRPAVVAHTDGRLSVFGIDAAGRVAYRSQTAPVSEDAPNGIWSGGWRALGDEKMRSVAVQPVRRGNFVALDVFAIGKDSDKLYQRSQLAAGSPTGSKEDVWVDWADLSAVGSDKCAPPGSLDCLTIMPSDLFLALNVKDPRDPGSRITRGNPLRSPAHLWTLRPTDDPGGAISIYNNATGRCVDEVDDTFPPYHLQLAACDPARVEQQWYIEPVLPANADKGTQTASDFRFRQRGERRFCLTALAADAGIHDGEQVERMNCDTDSPNDHNKWRLGSSAMLGKGPTAPGVLNIVLKQAAARCAANPDGNKCEFVALEEPRAYKAADGCVNGRVLYNQSPDRDAEYYISWARTSGTEFSFGQSIGLSVEFFSQEFNESFTWLQQSTVTEQVQIHVPPKRFGWVETAPVLRETIGYWKIRLDGYTWTVPGHNVSYAKEGTDGVESIPVARTSKTPPTSGRCDS
ncbi:hypothetical protein [Actinomadura atramentaria]|uniref:hypothetical protein n=1 Tax=Actinomadura atramentaria TaxID=1990 RepID=UPI0009FD1E34|nr:hypothetical protein [Actinomadura atramentaria]